MGMDPRSATELLTDALWIWKEEEAGGAWLGVCMCAHVVGRLLSCRLCSGLLMPSRIDVAPRALLGLAACRATRKNGFRRRVTIS